MNENRDFDRWFRPKYLKYFREATIEQRSFTTRSGLNIQIEVPNTCYVLTSLADCLHSFNLNVYRFSRRFGTSSLVSVSSTLKKLIFSLGHHKISNMKPIISIVIADAIAASLEEEFWNEVFRLRLNKITDYLSFRPLHIAHLTSRIHSHREAMPKISIWIDHFILHRFLVFFGARCANRSLNLMHSEPEKERKQKQFNLME